GGRPCGRWSFYSPCYIAKQVEWRLRYPWRSRAASGAVDPRTRARPGMPRAKPSPPPLIDPDLHAESFRQVREAHRLELVEDYVELISDLIRDGGEARQVDIAARMGVAQPTVAKMLKRLVKAGYVVQKPYRGAFLTDE